MFPPAVDWINFINATYAFVNNQNPYLVGEGFSKVYEPFWTYILLSPFAAFPDGIGRILFFIVSVCAFAFTAYKMGASKYQMIMFLWSAPVIGCLHDGNIDWLVTLGLWMPPQIGLFFVVMKPQIGAGVALYWLWATYRTGGWKYSLKIFAPVTIAYLFSFVVYGFWMDFLNGMDSNPGNMRTFPYLVPIGLYLLWVSLKKYDKKLSIVATPFIAPYVTLYNYSGLLLSLFNRPKLFVFAWITFWIPTFFR